jgi:3-oxoacyl-[acyl-carrier protein] reductase
MIYELSAETTAVITGASSGIGRATALALADKGMKLSLLGRSDQRLSAVETETKARGASGVLRFACDVRDESAVDRAIAATLGGFGRVDVLINSAGLSLNGAVDGYPLEDWRTVLDTNLTGTFLTCRAVLPAMKLQGGGQIINISSGAGRNGIKEMSAYCAAKFGVIGFTESLALEVRNQNIRVSVLLPGSVATGFSAVAKREGALTPSLEKDAGGKGADDRAPGAREIGYAMTAGEVASVIVAMLNQPPQAWMNEVTLRPLNLELRRTQS